MDNPDNGQGVTQNNGSNRTQIILAAFTLAGVLGTALFANWTGVFGAEEKADPIIDPTPGPIIDPQGETDLSFVGWSIEPKSPTEGRSFKVRVSVENRGQTRAGSFQVEWWAAVSAPQPAKTWRVSGLAPGEKEDLTFVYPGYSSWYPKQQTKVVIHPLAKIPDSNRKSNTWQRPITVLKK